MNKTKEVLAVLGLEIGEKFNIYGDEDLEEYNPYCFNKDCALLNCYQVTIINCLDRIFNGKLEIQKYKNPYKEFCTADEIKEMNIEISVDKKVYVKRFDMPAYKRHFNYLDRRDNKFKTFENGKTEFTNKPENRIESWDLIKLVEE